MPRSNAVLTLPPACSDSSRFSVNVAWRAADVDANHARTRRLSALRPQPVGRSVSRMHFDLVGWLKGAGDLAMHLLRQSLRTSDEVSAQGDKPIAFVLRRIGDHGFQKSIKDHANRATRLHAKFGHKHAAIDREIAR